MLRGPKRYQKNGPFGIGKKIGKILAKKSPKNQKIPKKIAKKSSKMRCARAFRDRGCDPELFILIVELVSL